MADEAAPGVTTALNHDTVSATVEVDAPPEEVFDYIRRPANHAAISGDNTVQDTVKGPEVLSAGDAFGMSMRLGVPYRISSKVQEFEADRRIAWAHFGGHRWRWEIEPLPDARSRVTETFDLSHARFPPALRILGYPAKHKANVARSVANVAAHFARP